MDDLIQRLRDYCTLNDYDPIPILDEAADRIDALKQENERLTSIQADTEAEAEAVVLRAEAAEAGEAHEAKRAGTMHLRALAAEAERDALKAALDEAEGQAWQEIGSLFGCPVGVRIPEYADHVRKTMGRLGSMKRVVAAAQDYFSECQEDCECVPKPQHKEMLAALDWYEALATKETQHDR